MPPLVATFVFASMVVWLFWLDRDNTSKTSAALWIPILWVALAGSRMVSQWIGIDSPIESAAQAVEGDLLDRVILGGLIVASGPGRHVSPGRAGVLPRSIHGPSSFRAPRYPTIPGRPLRTSTMRTPGASRRRASSAVSTRSRGVA